MNRIEVELPGELADFLERQVEAGLYKSVSDVVEDAVRRQYEGDDMRLDAVRAALAPGLAEAAAGIFYEGTMEDIIAEAKERYVKRR